MAVIIVMYVDHYFVEFLFGHHDHPQPDYPSPRKHKIQIVHRGIQGICDPS